MPPAEGERPWHRLGRLAGASLKLVWACVVVAAPACRPPPQASPPPAPPFSVTRPSRLPRRLAIRLDQHNGYLRAPVTINGQDAGQFLIDTGSALTAVSPTVAERLRLPSGEPGVARGIGGHEGFVYRHAQVVVVGDLRLEGQRLAALDLHAFSDSAGRFVGGLIGFGAFGAVPFTINYRSPTLTVYDPGRFQPPPEARAHRLWVANGLPMVRASIGDGHEVWLILDTGADTHVTLPIACAAAWPDIVLVKNSGRGRSKGIGGSVPSIHTWLTSMSLWDLQLHDVPVTFEPAPADHQAPQRVVGRIGSKMLKYFQLTFDPANGRVWVQWRPEG